MQGRPEALSTWGATPRSQFERNTVSRLLKTIAVAASIAAFGPASAALAQGGAPGGGGGGSATGGADLQVSGSASTGSLVVGQPYSYNFQIKNSGPQDAAGATFSDQLPAGAVLTGWTPSSGVSCSTTPDTGNGVLFTCNLGTLAKGGQDTISLSLNAPKATGTYANTGTASSTVADPVASNSSSTSTIKVGPLPNCGVPAGQSTWTGTVMEKFYNGAGQFQDFVLQINGTNYYVKTNFFDASLPQPLTSEVNLLCKAVNNVDAFTQGFDTDIVTGTDTGTTITLPGTTTPLEVIEASKVEVPYYFDKAV
jgi:uncharacterized repeat protein (TIGR01451 family)